MTSEPGREHTNRLIDATSPYLLQHAHNPVDWYPWGEEAFQKARQEDKPIFLSIGYSACHWCHVMERESFESEAIAEFLNDHFVSIKVDREERPDVDETYMAAVQMMTGSGGWPMSVFLTPDLRPFYGGTYFPPRDMMGRPGFPRLLMAMADAWQHRRQELLINAEDLTRLVRQSLSESERAGVLTPDLLTQAVHQLGSSFDPVDGGFDGAPKFPSSPSIRLLLREYVRSGNPKILQMATTTLDKMAYGGMYDQLGGGFARYSVDSEWLVPHFEKMLYDNAQLAQAYLEAYQLTKEPLYRRVASEIFEYELRDMRDSRGGFHSAEDADSEGEEGKFYLWTYDETLDALGGEDGKLFAAYYDVQPGGNFSSHESYHRGKNILHMPQPAHAVAAQLGVTEEALEQRMAPLRAKLLALREQRVRPGLDDKVLTAWNGLMISALSQGYQILGDARYLATAQEAARFIVTDMATDGCLLRTHRHGTSAIPAFLEDYSYFVCALLDLYEASFDVTWIEAAHEFTNTMIAGFWDDSIGAFYSTNKQHDHVLVRATPTQDGATPSGNSMAAMALLRLAVLTDNGGFRDKAERILGSNAENMQKYSRAFLQGLLAVDWLMYPPAEIAVVGSDDDDTRALLDVVREEFVPNKVLAMRDTASHDRATVEARIPLLAGKDLVGGKPAAYLCKNFACDAPVTDPAALADKLESALSESAAR